MCGHGRSPNEDGLWLPINLLGVHRGQGRYKLAFSLNELVALTSEFSTKKAPNCLASVTRTDTKAFLLTYRVVCKESYSDPRGHKVSIKFDPTKIDSESTVDNLDVRVQCSCPAFLYWGAQWNLFDGDALYGTPRPMLQPPTEGKRFQFVICKHIKVVSDRITPVIARLLERYRDDDAKKKQKEVDRVLQKHEDEAPKKAPGKGKNVKVVDDEAPKTKAPGKTTPKTPSPYPTKPETPAKKEAPKKEPAKSKKPEPVVVKQEVTRKGPVKTYGPPKKAPSNVTVYDDDDDGIIKINRLLKDLSRLIPKED
jgi:hypothetical protein